MKFPMSKVVPLVEDVLKASSSFLKFRLFFSSWKSSKRFDLVESRGDARMNDII